jgi:copper oxidase (laccase) domain-containing protein
MKTVSVVFDGTSKEYDYFVDDSVSVKAGDTAVAHTGDRGGLKLVRVTKVRKGACSKNAIKTLVAVIGDAEMLAYTEFNKQIAEKREALERLDELLAIEMESNKYRLLAASNPEAAELMKKLGI